jgi:lipopolysaccharide transport system permease protein
MKMVSTVRYLFQYDEFASYKINYLKDLIVVLTKKELKIRYNNNVLGYFWSIGNPLAFGLVYWFVFCIIMKSPVENFPLFLVAGLFPWQWMANSIAVGPMTFVGNSPIIKKVRFPRNLISLVVVIQDMIHFWASIPIIIIFLFYFNMRPTFHWIYGIFILSIIQLIFTYSLNLLIATINLFFRDMEKLTGILTTFMFYLTPVLYSIDLVPERFRQFLIFHPLAHLMNAWRTLFIKGYLDWFSVAQSLVVALIIFLLAQSVFNKLQFRFAEVI